MITLQALVETTCRLVAECAAPAPVYSEAPPTSAEYPHVLVVAQQITFDDELTGIQAPEAVESLATVFTMSVRSLDFSGTEARAIVDRMRPQLTRRTQSQPGWRLFVHRGTWRRVDSETEYICELDLNVQAQEV